MYFQGIDHIEFYVADLDHACARFRDQWGFTVLARAETLPDRASVLLGQGNTRMMVTAPRGDTGAVADFVARHGDGVRVLALAVPDAAAAYEHAVRGGAAGIQEPTRGGGLVMATVAGIETMAVTFVEHRSRGELPPGFVAVPAAGHARGAAPCLLEEVDHLAICVPRGRLSGIADECQRTLGLRRVFSDVLEFGDQVMESVVVEDARGAVTLTLVSPGCDSGQLVNYLESFGGGGVQHLAFRTRDIASAMPSLASRGIEFLPAPEQYYDALPRRLDLPAAELDRAARLGLLVDRDQWGDLLQVFTRSPFERRTVFFELIERRRARTFGAANIKALYEAAEREQAEAVPAGGAAR